MNEQIKRGIFHMRENGAPHGFPLSMTELLQDIYPEFHYIENMGPFSVLGEGTVY